MKIIFCLLLLILISAKAFAQETLFLSVHQEESEYYSKLNITTEKQFDSLHQYPAFPKMYALANRQLNKIVFGYHPYWIGSAYYYYQWYLLSDLCYFSYEVDPATGDPLTTYNFLTAPVIDSALEHNTRVHLCVTLFSGHTQFFNNPDAQQNLINNLITLLQQRNAKGVNIDFEAVPSGYSTHITTFMLNLAQQLHAAIPGSLVSMATPAVDWNGCFDIPALNDIIDLFVIMGYDYYWNGSSQAGPVDGLYSMTPSYDYNLSRTLSWYQKMGASEGKILLGLPYYGRQWPTESQYAPSNTTGYGQALTYYNIRNNSSGYYSEENKLWEYYSFSPYYSFYNQGWHQCFIDDVFSLGKRYDMVNMRGIAGIGIWALGYDYGYTELWDLIGNRFSSSAIVKISDTIYDSGGPMFYYYNDEEYLLKLNTLDDAVIQLSFNAFDLEQGYDFLSVYDGADTLQPLLGKYTGCDIPEYLLSSGNTMTLHFFSDGYTTRPGFEAVWNALPVGIRQSAFKCHIQIYPNPCKGEFTLDLRLEEDAELAFSIMNAGGDLIAHIASESFSAGYHKIYVDMGRYGIDKPGIYFLVIDIGGKVTAIQKVVLFPSYSPHKAH